MEMPREVRAEGGEGEGGGEGGGEDDMSRGRVNAGEYMAGCSREELAS